MFVFFLGIPHVTKKLVASAVEVWSSLLDHQGNAGTHVFDHFAIKLPCRTQLSPIQSKSAPTKLDKHPTERLLENSIPKHSSSLLQEDFSDSAGLCHSPQFHLHSVESA